MPKIYSYRRVSTTRQGEGVSLELQSNLKALNKLSDEHSLPVAERIYSDVGKSAYKGEQLKNELGYFLSGVLVGEIKKGSILCVYSLDRLSRQNLGFAKQIYLDLTNNDISIYSILDNHLYKAHNAADDILATIIFERSHNESATKGARSNAKALDVIEKHLEGVKTHDGYAYQTSFGNNPWWITNREDSAVIPHPIYWHAAKDVYTMTLNGDGTQKILNYLNENYPAPRGKPKAPSDKRLAEWKFSTIANFHKRKALYGHKEVLVYKGKPDQKTYQLAGYYPAIMSKQEWLALQTIKKNRQTSDSRRKRYNLITGIGVAKCKECGAVVAAAMDKSSKRITSRFFCAGRRNLQNGCKGFSMRGKWLESTVLGLCSGHVFTAPEVDDTALLALEAERGELSKKLSKVKELFINNVDMMDELAPQLTKIKNDLNAVESKISHEQQQLAKHSITAETDLEKLHLKWQKLKEEALNEDNQEVRKATRDLVKQSFKKIEVCKYDNGYHIKIHLIDGKVKYAIMNGKRESQAAYAEITMCDQDFFQQVKETTPELANTLITAESQLHDIDFKKLHNVQVKKINFQPSSRYAISHKIKTIAELKSKGLSQSKVVEKSGMSLSSVKRYWNNEG